MNTDKHGCQRLPHAAFPNIFHIPGEEALERPAVAFESNEWPVQGRKRRTWQEPVGRADAEDVEQQENRRQEEPAKDPCSRPTVGLVAHRTRLASVSSG